MKQIANNEFSLVDEQIKSHLVNNLHTALPGEVISFNPQTQTAEVQPVGKVKLQNGESVTMPPCLDVPVKFPFGGGFGLTFPVKAGDTCLIIFAEKNIDNWYAGQNEEEQDTRRFDLSDGFALVGFANQKTAISNFDMSGTCLRNKDNTVNIKLDDSSITSIVSGAELKLTASKLTCSVPIEAPQVSAPSIKAGGVEMTNHKHKYTDNGSPLDTQAAT